MGSEKRPLLIGSPSLQSYYMHYDIQKIARFTIHIVHEFSHHQPSLPFSFLIHFLTSDYPSPLCILLSNPTFLPFPTLSCTFFSAHRC